MTKKYYPEGGLLETRENLEYCKDAAGLQRAAETGAIVEARAVICDSAHNLIVDLGEVRGIIPREEGAIGISDGSVRDIAVISRVNKCVCFKVRRVYKNEAGRWEALLSRRIAQEECFNRYLYTLMPGDIIDAKVTHLEPFGAFVDVGCGIPSLIPIDAISISRISHPSDRFTVGQDIKAIIREVDCFSGRITLSHKELLGTWEENAQNFSAGDTVAGIIRSIESYGIFVELTPNLAGLAELREDVAVGQHASVYIKSLIPEKMKVKLIIIDSFDAHFRTPPLNYFLKSGNIGSWTYSPERCSKVIETVF